MFKAFRDRRPWAAVVISLFVGPWLGMAFLNRGRMALNYLIALGILMVTIFGALPTTFLSTGSSFKTIFQYSNTILALAGSVHAYFIARKWDAGQQLAWYSRRWYLILIVPVGLVFGLLGIRAFLYQPFNIPSGSMSPSVNRGDAFLVSKLAYSSAAPQRGDVIVFWSEHYHAHFVKRVIGIPNDRVQMVGGRVVLNGVRIPVRSVSAFSASCDTGFGCLVPQFEEIYPGGKIVRILDGVANGPLDNTDTFTVPANSVFVLGDNRDNSNDSREDIGFVPRSAILGKVAYKYAAGGRWVWQPVQ